MRPLAFCILAFAGAGLFSGCGGAPEQPFDPHEVQSAFAHEGQPLAQRSLGQEADQWGTLLVSTDVDAGVEVQVYADPKTARNLAGSFAGFQSPLAEGPRYEVVRRENVVVVLLTDSPPGVRGRIERALDRLSATS